MLRKSSNPHEPMTRECSPMKTEPLSPEHRRMLKEDNTITPEIIATQGYCTITSQSI